MNFFKTRVRKIPYWALLLIIAILLSPVKEVNVPADGAWYLSLGLNIHNGQGYVNPDLSPVYLRPPGFSFLLAIFFWLFGVSVKSAFLLNRIFFIINPLIIYFLGKILWDKKVGLVAGLLLLSSYSINSWSALIHYDHIVPTFILFSILLCVLALKKTKWWLFVASGVFLAAGYWVKEVALIFFPFPIFAWLFIKDFRSKKNLYGILWFVLAFGFCIFPWLWYISSRGSPLLGLAGGNVIQVLFRPFLASAHPNLPLATKTYYLTGLLEYYRYALAPYFILAPLFVIAWIFTFIRAAFKHRPEIILTILFALFIPIIYFCSMYVGRVRQGVVFFFLCYLALAHFLIWLTQIIKPQKGSSKIRTLITVILIMAVVFPQISLGKNNLTEYIKKIKPVRALVRRNYSLGLKGHHYSGTRAAGEWIVKNIPPGTPILSDHPLLTSIYFYSQGHYPLYRSPIVSSLEFGGVWHEKAARKRKVLFLYLDGWWTRYSKKIRAIPEDELLSILKNESIDYVIVTSRTNFESLYYYANPGFSKVAEFDEGKIKIFKVNKLGAYDFDTHIEARVRPYLQNLKENNPEGFKYIADHFFKDYLGWGEDMIDEIINPGYIGDRWQSIYFKKNFTNQPIIMAEIQTASNVDRPISLLIKDIQPSQAKMKLDLRKPDNDFIEKQQVAYCAWDNKDVMTSGVREGGKFELSQQSKTINLINSYKDPVIIAKLSTDNNPGVGVYIKNMTPRSFDICLLPRADGENNDLGVQGLVSYYVRESISVSYGEKKALEAHNVEVDIANNTAQYIKFPSPFDIKPIVLTSARIKDGCNKFNYQIESVSKNGFKVKLFNSIDSKETCQKAFISYMAIRPGVSKNLEVSLAEKYPTVHVSEIY
jgi:hypothetical protein